MQVPDPFANVSLHELTASLFYEYQGGGTRLSIPQMLKIGKIYNAVQIMNIIFCAGRRFDESIPGIIEMRLTSQLMFIQSLLQVSSKIPV